VGCPHLIPADVEAGLDIDFSRMKRPTPVMLRVHAFMAAN